jgi:hypothetical protein
LTAPVLFLFFFGIIQLAYTAYVSFAVQRAAYSIAREASSSGSPENYDPYFQLFYCLYPIGQLHHATLGTLLATTCSITSDDDGVHVRIVYPMPIWVPMVGKIFGEKLQLSASDLGPLTNDLQQVSQILGKPLPDLSFTGAALPYVHLMTFTADGFDENTAVSQDSTP